jgi:hypothetical protein
MGPGVDTTALRPARSAAFEGARPRGSRERVVVVIAPNPAATSGSVRR